MLRPLGSASLGHPEELLELGEAGFGTTDVTKVIFRRLSGYHYLKVVKCCYSQYSHERQSNEI